jgi:hypothetical protein
MRIVAAKVGRAVAAQVLEPHPDVGVDVLDPMTEVDVTVGVRQSAGNEEAARHRRTRGAACDARTRSAAGLALCLGLFGCSNAKPRPDRPTPALRTRTEIAGEFTPPPEPFGKRCTPQKDAKQARTLVSCNAGEVLVILPGLNWEVSSYLQEDTLFRASASGLEVVLSVADPRFNFLDAPQFLRKRYEYNAGVDPHGTFYQFSKPEPWFDAEPPVLAFTVIGNPTGEYHYYAEVITVRRRADRRFVVYQVSQSGYAGDGPEVWKGPQPRYLLERVRDFPKSFWIFDRDGNQLPQ